MVTVPEQGIRNDTGRMRGKMHGKALCVLNKPGCIILVNVHVRLAHHRYFLYIGRMIEMAMGKDDFPDSVTVFRDSDRVDPCIDENVPDEV